MTHDIVTLADSDGTYTAGLDDPGQLLYPRLRPGSHWDPRIDWQPADTGIVRHTTAGLTVSIQDNGMKTLLDVPGGEVDMNISDRRVVLVHADVDPGASALTNAAGWVLGRGVSGIRDLSRSVAGALDLRPRYHLLAQIDLRTCTVIRFYQTKMFGTRSLLSIWAFTGESKPRTIMGLDTSFSRKVKMRALAEDLVGRAQRAQLAQTVVPLDAEQREQIRAVRLQPSGDGFIAVFPAIVSLKRLSRLDQTAAAEPVRQAPAADTAPPAPTVPAGRDPGWYADPDRSVPYRRRWWDGDAWTAATDPPA